MKYSLLMVAMWLLQSTTNLYGQVDKKKFDAYFCNTDWVPVILMGDTVNDYYDLMVTRFTLDNKVLIKSDIESAEFEDENGEKWTYTDGILSLVLREQDEEGEVYFEKYNDIKIIRLNQDELLLKVFLEDGNTKFVQFLRLGYFRNLDLSAYEKATEQNTIESLQGYCKLYPYGKYIDQINKKLGNKKWLLIKETKNITELREFSLQFKDMSYGDSAKRLIDDIFWEKANNSNSTEEVEDYLDNYWVDIKYRKIKSVQILENLYWNQIVNDPTLKNYNTYFNKMNRWNDYKPAHLDTVLNYLDQIHYEEAVNSNEVVLYNRYLMLHKNGKHLVEIKERLVYAKVVKLNTLEAYKEYVSIYPNGIFSDKANNILKATYIYWGDAALKNCRANYLLLNETFEKNYTNALMYFNMYLKEFPKDTQINIAKKAIEELYLLKAKGSFKNKNYAQSNIYYLKCVETSPNSPQLEEWKLAIKENEKLLKWANRRDKVFIEYPWGKTSFLGLSLGTVNAHKIGGFYWIKGSPYTSSSLYTYNSSRNSYTLPMLNQQLTGEKRYASFSAVVGITHALAYPLFGYVGIGYNNTTTLVQVREYENGINTKVVWVKDLAKKYSGPELAGGLNLSYKRLSISGGASIINFQQAFFNFGLGLSIYR